MDSPLAPDPGQRPSGEEVLLDLNVLFAFFLIGLVSMREAAKSNNPLFDDTTRTSVHLDVDRISSHCQFRRPKIHPVCHIILTSRPSLHVRKQAIKDLRTSASVPGRSCWMLSGRISGGPIAPALFLWVRKGDPELRFLADDGALEQSACQICCRSSTL